MLDGQLKHADYLMTSSRMAKGKYTTSSRFLTNALYDKHTTSLRIPFECLTANATHDFFTISSSSRYAHECLTTNTRLSHDFLTNALRPTHDFFTISSQMPYDRHTNSSRFPHLRHLTANTGLLFHTIYIDYRTYCLKTPE